MSPVSLWTWLNLSRRWELKLLLTGDSARRSQQTHASSPTTRTTTRWWSVGSSAPLFTRVSGTAANQTTRLQRRSSNCGLRCPGAKCTCGHLFVTVTIIIQQKNTAQVQIRRGHSSQTFFSTPSKDSKKGGYP